jgi:hypothetical protein
MCGASRCIARRVDISGYDWRWKAWGCHTLRDGGSFALVRRSEEWGGNTKARDVLIIQVVIAIVFEQELGFSM